MTYQIVIHLMAFGFVCWTVAWLRHFIANRYARKVIDAWHAEEAEANLGAEATIYCPPSYGLRIVK
jgi:hypothetical protein